MFNNSRGFASKILKNTHFDSLKYKYIINIQSTDCMNVYTPQDYMYIIPCAVKAGQCHMCLVRSPNNQVSSMALTSFYSKYSPLTVVEADASLVPVELKARAARGESWAGITATAFRLTASNTWISPFYRKQCNNVRMET